MFATYDINITISLHSPINNKFSLIATDISPKENTEHVPLCYLHSNVFVTFFYSKYIEG